MKKEMAVENNKMVIVHDASNRRYNLMQDEKRIDFSSSASVLRRKYGKDIEIIK